MSVVTALVSIAIVVVVAGQIAGLAGANDWIFRPAVTTAGSLVLLIALLLPVVTARDESLHARGFVGYGLTPGFLSLALPLTDLLSLPAALLVLYTVIVSSGWAAVPGAVGVAVVSGVVLVILGLQLVRLGSTLGAWLIRREHGTPVRVAVALVLLALAALLLAPPLADPRYLGAALVPVGAFLAVTPFGALWDAPGRIADGSSPWGVILIGIGVVALLGVVWWFIIGREFHGRRAPRSEEVVDDALGAFRFVPSGRLAAITARSAAYWLRDPRYRVSLIVLPVIPLVTFVAGVVGKVPAEYFALVPVPAMLVVLGWATMHNDVAFDSSAVWSHVVAGVRGVWDRLGRAIPPFVIGLVLLAIGVPLSALAGGDWALVAPLIGLGSAALLGGIGVSSAVSARFPYAAPPPGAQGFEAPSSSGSGAGAQTLSFAAVLLVIAPAATATVLWLQQGGDWDTIALLAGIGAGLIAAVLGIWLGGRSFERRGPELVAFSVRN
ncbi:hypothetical protein FJ656_15220 [Schumannella luteola]|uniref:ABC-2 type transport system permease protein n=1 Tax=Schumannella luteola TaxID=472059 RepID=A0A852YEI3_9MICO|nr:hypothetical protein [Schumannella luteola]NYG99561.1 ABC-2 type transport system permease protein [Schumannella luteola]TPX03877.1 hypothetical protein FJ656_15220 [Schumannella luteola]